MSCEEEKYVLLVLFFALVPVLVEDKTFPLCHQQKRCQNILLPVIIQPTMKSRRLWLGEWIGFSDSKQHQCLSVVHDQIPSYRLKL